MEGYRPDPKHDSNDRTFSATSTCSSSLKVPLTPARVGSSVDRLGVFCERNSILSRTARRSTYTALNGGCILFRDGAIDFKPPERQIVELFPFAPWFRSHTLSLFQNPKPCSPSATSARISRSTRFRYSSRYPKVLVRCSATSFSRYRAKFGKMRSVNSYS